MSEKMQYNGYIDFSNPEDKCSECGRRLEVKTIYYNKKLYGPKCARNSFINIASLPDLTKGTLLDNSKNIQSNAANSIEVQKNIKKESPNIKRAFEYLLLRFEKLSDIQGMASYEILKNYYENYKSDKITDTEITHINNIINKTNSAKSKFSEDNVRFCYAVKHILNFLLKKYPDNKFYNNLMITLKKDATISKRQFDALMKNTSTKIRYYEYVKNM